MSQHAPHPAAALLTRNPLKAQLYSQEPYFRESFLDLEAFLGADTTGAVLRHGMIVVKPDGYALGCAGAVIDFCARHGFEALDARPVAFGSVTWRLLWTYQMTQASIDRLLVNDLLLRGDAIAILLRAGMDSGLPAAVQLSALKGPARMDRQDDTCLRRAIGQPNLIFSLVHSADEPADLVRELGILFGIRERRELASAMARGRPSPAGERRLAEARRSAARPLRAFDRDASRAGVTSAVRARLLDSQPMPPGSREALSRGVDALQAARPIRLPEFLGAMIDGGVTADPWDLAVTFSELIQPDEPGSSKIIDNLGAAQWECPDRRDPAP